MRQTLNPTTKPTYFSYAILTVGVATTCAVGVLILIEVVIAIFRTCSITLYCISYYHIPSIFIDFGPSSNFGAHFSLLA